MVNYPNNSELKYEKIYFDSNNKLKKVEVYNVDNKKEIIVKFSKINLNKNIDDKYFKIDEYISNKEEVCEGTNCEKTTLNVLDDVIYPLYLPGNTYLTSSEKIGDELSKRVILTFTGEKPFTLIEEASKISDEFSVTPVYGDIAFINDTIGVVSSNYIKWNKDNIDYYLTSNTLTKSEMISVASSITDAKSVSGSK
ncbi:MAG: outer membrane lipoprotein carrier protein LolA [Bacilli bacterium]|nr:outer membrane lipoprotein carrier protein LolA [Bacilli bacterium]